MSQHENLSGSQPAPSYQPASEQVGQQQFAPQAGYQPPVQSGYAPAPLGAQTPPNSPKSRNVIGLIALIVAVVGFIFACIPGALIVGWVLLPTAFILAIVSFFQRGKGKGFGIAALIISVVGTIVGAIVFSAVVAASFDQAFNEETSVVAQPSEAAGTDGGAAAPAEEAAEEQPAAEQGTRDNPVPLGSTITSDEWTVTVDAYNPAGNEVVAAANQFNEPPTPGSHYEIVTYTVTYTGAESSFALMVGLDLVTSSGNVVDTTETLASLEDSMGLDELFNGATTSGSQAFLVPDGESVLIRVRPGMLADEVFVQP